MNGLAGRRWSGRVLAGLVALGAAACTAQGVSQTDVETLASEREALQRQLASIAPTRVMQAGQLAPAPPAGAQPGGWDTPESIRGRLTLFATYDSSGPDAWDVAAHPMVYFTSEGVGANPNGGTRASGVHVIDAYTKQVIASALYDLGEEVTENPHGVGVSPDGRWVYIGEMHRVAATGQTRSVLMIINARTLKLDKVLEGPRVDWFHHMTSFKDWQGRDRVMVAFGRNPGGGPHWLLDPHDDNRVVQAITIEDIGYKIGHPYPTPDPTGRFVYVSVFAPPWRSQNHNTAGIAKLNLETGAVTIVPYVGDNPIGMAHTADGRFTYVNDAYGSKVYKIDNETNEVVDNTMAGVSGPYGLVLDWGEQYLYAIGKGEGTHNNGSVVGLIETQRFVSPRNFIHNMPIWLGGSASSIDHGILHPDPEVNELWISNMHGWETIVLDLATHEVKAYIPTPNGGDTHSGAFVRYNADWTGEVLADMGGPHRAMYETKRQRMAAGSVPAPEPRPAAPQVEGQTALARGQVLFEKTAGGVGCAYCHGQDGRGNVAMGAPDIRGATEDRIRQALTGVVVMSGIRLNDAELEAVVEWLRHLNEQP